MIAQRRRPPAGPATGRNRGLALAAGLLDPHDERRVGGCGAHRHGGDEVAVDVALGEVALQRQLGRSDRAIVGAGADQQLPVDRVERQRMMGVEDRLQLLAVVDLEVRQPVGDDRRFPLELEQLATPLCSCGSPRDAGTKKATTASVVVSSTARRTRRLMCSGAPFEAVADAADRRDPARRPACSPSLRRIELMWTSSVLVDPHQFSSHTSSIRRSRVTAAPADSAEHPDHVELLRSQRDLGAVERHPPGGDVDACRSSSSIARFDRRRRCVCARVAHAEVGRDPGQQLGEAERLDDVVDGARLEPEHDVDLRVAGGEHDHRDRRVLPRGMHGDLRSVAVGEAEVEQHEVGRIGVERRDRASPRCRPCVAS